MAEIRAQGGIGKNLLAADTLHNGDANREWSTESNLKPTGVYDFQNGWAHVARYVLNVI